MNNLEQELRDIDKRKNIQKIILRSIYALGILSVGAIAPNVFQIIKMFEDPDKRKKNLKYTINRSFTRLREKGFVEIIEINGKKVARLTKKGEAQIGFLEKHNFKIKKPKRWDGRWRVVIFDIIERKKKTRSILRQTLQQIGFVKLQQSVWVYPYDCEDLVSLLKADFKLGKEVLYMIVDKLENDWQLRLDFKLPNSNGRKS
ncbi:MAG: hypothetical protein KBD52_02245 [Candidatus Pacebacteria bacterium]|nr:hypothetical protein [Candidatus Paceibacterota bacterium]